MKYFDMVSYSCPTTLEINGHNKATQLLGLYAKANLMFQRNYININKTLIDIFC